MESVGCLALGDSCGALWRFMKKDRNKKIMEKDEESLLRLEHAA